MNLSLSHIEPNNGQLKGLPKNPRFIRDSRFQDLKNSIQNDPDFLEYRELLVYPLSNDKYIVIGGNMRLRAMQELGISECPVKIIDPATPIEKLREIVIKDNNSYGRFDWDVLANDFEYIEVKNAGVELHWDEQEELDGGLFELQEQKATDKEEKLPIIKISCGAETTEEDLTSIREKIEQVLSNYSNCNIL